MRLDSVVHFVSIFWRELRGRRRRSGSACDLSALTFLSIMGKVIHDSLSGVAAVAADILKSSPRFGVYLVRLSVLDGRAG
jgi:hypothetical protein